MRYARGSQTAWRRIAGETVVIDLGAKRMVGLNETGGAVWEALVAAPDLGELAAGLDGDAEREIHRFVEELVAEGLAERVDTAVSGAETAAAANGVPFVPPAITWREELLRFGGACNKQPEVSPFCNQFPFSS